MMQCQVGQSPIYIVDGKLGKGGFGQVYIGKRSPPTTDKDGPDANLVCTDYSHALCFQCIQLYRYIKC